MYNGIDMFYFNNIYFKIILLSDFIISIDGLITSQVIILFINLKLIFGSIKRINKNNQMYILHYSVWHLMVVYNFVVVHAFPKTESVACHPRVH